MFQKKQAQKPVKLFFSCRCIFLSWIVTEEAERLCERIAFIVKGRIVKTDTISNLLQPVQARKAMLFSVSNGAKALANKMVEAFPHFQCEAIASEQIRIESAETINIAPIVRFIEEQDVVVTEARRITPSLEEVFVRVTGIALDAIQKEKEKGKSGL